MAPLIVDPEWEKVWAHVVASTPMPEFTDAAQVREYCTTAMKHGFAPFPVIEGVQETKHEVTSLDGARINVRRFVPPSLPTDTKAHRAIVYLFGGGMVSGSVELFRTFITNIAEASQSQVFGVDYRVGFEKPFPAAVEDVYSAVAWLQENAQTFDVDPARILLFGPSAGGGVAAGTALFARDRGLKYPLAGQVLVAPMIDDRTVLPKENPLTPYLTWTSAMNELGWKAYLGGKEREERTDENVPIYAAPARAKDVSGLPPTYIDVGSLDLFKNEDFAYAAKLAAAGVEVEFHIYLGIPHGFEGVASNIRLTQVPFQNQINFVKNI
ncbi:Alpha/Beta hydrolase protein [Biscogniauxia mediterranea]|nr:Alpha/Beta hydrolase protein [Biscogniauxia mediterranea]